jgi:hypothetical protein
MHRSGTSLVTKSLETLGVELGNNLMPAVDKNNDKGFFEDLEINAFNIELLNVVESDWHFVEPLLEDDLKILFVKGYLDKAVELINKKIKNVDLFGFKDPRVSKLLPFWVSVFKRCELNVKYIIVIRNPVSVVKSLIKRDGLDYGKCYLIWLSHMIPSMHFSNFNQRVFVDYDYFLHNTEKELNRIGTAFELEVSLNKLNLFLSEFIDQSLRHEINTREDLEGDCNCPPLVKDIYLTLVDEIMSDNKHERTVFEQWESSWFNELIRMKSSFALVDDLWSQLSRSLSDNENFTLKLNKLREIIG